LAPLGYQDSFGKQRANQWKDEGVLASPPASKESLRVGERQCDIAWVSKAASPASKEALMSVAKRLKEYLEQNHVTYSHCTHRMAYTAQEVAAAQHVPGQNMAKTVVLKADDQYVMVVLPAPLKLDLEMLRRKLPFGRLELASEKDLAWLFMDSELGAMPPFGNLYNLPVFVDQSLAVRQEIVFNAGTHMDTIQMPYDDFERLVHPKVIYAAFATMCG
jgi:Ala-tRNA(Pro) deacylase